MHFIIPYTQKPNPSYVVAGKVFTEQELDYLQKCALASKEDGTVEDKEEKSAHVRRSLLTWMDDSMENHHLFQRLAELVSSINCQTFKFELTCLAEQIQLAAYNANDRGCYDWHQDHNNSEVSRKLTVITQLSGELQYEGGELEIWSGAVGPERIPRRRGTTIIFPSYQLHRVTEVSSGVRCSLTAWISGPPFR